MADTLRLTAREIYAQKLLDPRWQKKRLQIFERDQWCCVLCHNDRQTLHVHHRYYRTGCDPWDYPADALQTLCAVCHEQETLQRPHAEGALLAALDALQLPHEILGMLGVSFEHWRHWQLSSPQKNSFVMALLYLMNDKQRMQAYADSFDGVVSHYGSDWYLAGVQALTEAAKLYIDTYQLERQPVWSSHRELT